MQLGGVFILLLLLYFYKRQGTLGLYTGRLFLSALYLTLLCLILDIFSLVLIAHQDTLPIWLVKGECKLYLISLVIQGYMGLLYTHADIRKRARADKFTYIITAGVTVMSLFILIAPIQIYYDGINWAYTYGLACSLTYVSAILLILSTLVMVFIQGKTMNPKRRNAIIFWMVIWIIAAATQFLFSKLLLVGFAGAVGMVILFFELENPEIYIDRNTGFYNNYALVEYLKQRYQLAKPCYGILVSLESMHERPAYSAKLETALPEVMQFLRQLPETLVFKTDDREFSLSFESEASYEQVRQMIFSRFQEGWLKNDGDSPDSIPFLIQPYYLLIPTSAVAKTAEELLALLRHFRLYYANTPGNYILTLNEDVIAQKQKRDDMLGIITRAIKYDLIEVFYQPIYSISQEKFVSAEALARIRRSDGSIVPPGLFIPIAEETGLISQIGEIVFEKTCGFIKENHLEQYEIDHIDVNLSVAQCESDKLSETYIDILKKYEVEPQYINLEITESASIANKKALLKNMQALIKYGVSFSLDDFGMGQANLDYITNLPIQIVKFDHKMTQAYFKNSKARFVMQASIKMIHDMRLDIVSEGVETAEQLAVLKELGVDYIQGYYFSKPIEADAYLAFIKERNQ